MSEIIQSNNNGNLFDWLPKGWLKDYPLFQVYVHVI